MTQPVRKLAAAMFRPKYEQVSGGRERISAHTILQFLKANMEANVEQDCGEISGITLRGSGKFLSMPRHPGRFEPGFKTFTGSISFDNLSLEDTMQFIEENFDPSIGYDEKCSHWYNLRGSRDSHGHKYRVGIEWSYLIQIDRTRETHRLGLKMMDTGISNDHCNYKKYPLYYYPCSLNRMSQEEFERFERRRLPLEAEIAFTMSHRIRLGIVKGTFEI